MNSLPRLIALLLLSTNLDLRLDTRWRSILPDPAKTRPVLLLTTDHYSEGVVFDRDGYGYLSQGATIIRFDLGGKPTIWAETGGIPNGHKILPDGTHLVCDGKRHAVLHLSTSGRPLE